MAIADVSAVVEVELLAESGESIVRAPAVDTTKVIIVDLTALEASKAWSVRIIGTDGSERVVPARWKEAQRAS
jgi:hypothetical protein